MDIELKNKVAVLLLVSSLCAIGFAGCSCTDGDRFKDLAGRFRNCDGMRDGYCVQLDSEKANAIHDYITSSMGLSKHKFDCFECYFSAVMWFVQRKEYDKAGICWARASYLLGSSMPPSEWVLASICAANGISARDSAMIIYQASLSSIDGRVEATLAMNRSFDIGVVPCLLGQCGETTIVLSHEWEHRLQNLWFAVSDVDMPLFVTVIEAGVSAKNPIGGSSTVMQSADTNDEAHQPSAPQ